MMNVILLSYLTAMLFYSDVNVCVLTRCHSHLLLIAHVYLMKFTAADRSHAPHMSLIASKDLALEALPTCNVAKGHYSSQL